MHINLSSRISSKIRVSTIDGCRLTGMPMIIYRKWVCNSLISSGNGNEHEEMIRLSFEIISKTVSSSTSNFFIVSGIMIVEKVTFNS